MTRVPVPGGEWFVKAHHVRSVGARLKYLVAPSRAAAEWRAARAMRAAGLPVPAAVLAGERRRFGVLLGGVFAVEGVPAPTDLVPFVNRHLDGGRAVVPTRALLADLARLVRRMHDAGFSHGDLHSGNLLVTGGPDAPRISLIDLHTVRIRSGGVPGRERRANLAKLLHSLLTVTNEPGMLRFLAAYEGESPVLGSRREVAARLLGRARALERRRVRSRTRRCIRDSSGFVVERSGAWRRIRRRETPPDSVRLAWEGHLRTIAAGGPAVLKRGGRSRISRQILEGAEEPTPVVVKETRVRGALDVLKNAVRRPRARASWVNGNGLLVRHVRAARPFAVATKGGWPIRREGVLLMEDLSAHSRLDLFVLKRYAGELTPARRAEKLRLVRAFARFVRDLHRRGIYHGDLKAVNVFVSYPDGGDPRFFLVDYDRVRFGRRVSRRRRVKNLAQIAASVAVLVTRTDRLRFYREWCPDEDAVRGEKAYNRRVARALAKKIVVRIEPIE